MAAKATPSTAPWETWTTQPARPFGGGASVYSEGMATSSTALFITDISAPITMAPAIPPTTPGFQASVVVNCASSVVVVAVDITP
jgi:hypothetical protein